MISPQNNDAVDGYHRHPHVVVVCVADVIVVVCVADVMVSYWHRAVHQEISDFFNILE